MASVFLSYDREDVAKARLIALALEKAGHQVWWDQHIRGGAQYSKEIETALKAADAVVVLWSVYSIDSAWVRDEAAAGRDSGLLIPVTIDGTEPPLGFRQYQTINLSSARSERGGRMRRLIDAIDGIVTRSVCDGDGQVTHPAAIVTRGRWFAPSWRVYAIVAALAAVAGGGALWLTHGTADAISVTIAASDPSAESNRLARELLFKLSSLQGRRNSQVRIVGGGQAKTADLVFQTALRTDAGANHATLALLSQTDDEILWSGEVEPKSGQLPDLEQQLAYSAARILDCAYHALAPGAKLSGGTLKLYLNGCARIAEVIGYDASEVLPQFEQVTREAPGFVDGWAKLLLAYSASAYPEEKVAREGRLIRMKDALARARALEPTLPEITLATLSMLPRAALDERFRLLDGALAQHPDNAGLLNERSDHLASIGRFNEAIDDARSASAADPLNAASENSYILRLAHAGQIESAFRELDRAERLWPGASNINETKFWLNFRFGDPNVALDLMRQGATRLPTQVQLVAIAKIDPSHGNLERARKLIRQALHQDWSPGPVQGAMVLGIQSELWPLLLGGQPVHGGIVAVTLYPAFRTFRYDPRFMRFVARTEVLDYWRSSGHWPDFCREPDLPYDCEAEAAKARQRKGGA